MERFLMSQQAVKKYHGNQKHSTKKLNEQITWERYPQTHTSMPVWVAHIRLRIRPGDGFSAKWY